MNTNRDQIQRLLSHLQTIQNQQNRLITDLQNLTNHERITPLLHHLCALQHEQDRIVAELLLVSPPQLDSNRFESNDEDTSDSEDFPDPPNIQWIYPDPNPETQHSPSGLP